MLLSLTIRNIALVENQTISFHKGMHTLTGETGAGKSIIIDSLNLILGGRADRELIRSGAERAFVEAQFDVSGNQPVLDALLSQSLEPEDGVISITREITLSGKNTCRVLGMMVSLSFIREITPYLFDLHGQHQHQLLMDENNHLRYLDNFGDDHHRSLMEQTEKAYQDVHQAGQAYQKAKKETATREQRMDMLSFQLKELGDAKLVEGEEEELQNKSRLFRYQEKCFDAIQGACTAIAENAAEQVQDAAGLLEGIADLDPKYRRLAERLHSLYLEADDIGQELTRLTNSQAFDPEHADLVASRLDLLKKLERKYAPDEAGLIAYYRQIAEEYKKLTALDDTLEVLAEEYKKKLKNYRAAAGELHQSRVELAAAFSGEIESQLSDLGMKSTKFIVDFIPPEEGKKVLPQATGDDHVVFLIAPNPREPARSLAKTASGGELSRLMLAIKAANARRCLTPCMIFDEIDTGISGRIAQVVAEKMAMLGEYHQVICVTHLPQLSAMADYAYKVEKQVVDGRTVSGVRLLTDDEHLAETARIIGGAEETSKIHAATLIQDAEAYKVHLRGHLAKD